VRNNDGNNGNDDTASGSHGVYLVGKDLHLILREKIRVITTTSTASTKTFISRRLLNVPRARASSISPIECPLTHILKRISPIEYSLTQS